MQTPKRLEYKPDPNKFDLRTHTWDAQGRLTDINLYRQFIVGDRNYFERPVGSGNLWLENNQPAGRVEYKVNDKGHIYEKTFLVGDKAVAHKDYVEPLKGAEKVHFELQQANARAAAAEAELAAIRKEQEAKQTPVSQTQAAPQRGEAPTLSKRG